MKMRITGTRSCIMVEYDYRTVKIAGELTTAPAFYADRSSIKKWEPPYDNVEITTEEIALIVNRILEQTNDAFKIFFE